MQEQIEVQKLLHEKLTEIRHRNPAYSMRAFARKAGLGSSALSEILNGKRRISRKIAQRISERLALDPDRSQRLLSQFSPTRTAIRPPAPPTQLTMDQFRLVSEWYHFAILSLIELKDYQHNALWISTRLNIKEIEAEQAMERLLRLQMIEILPTGKVQKTVNQFTTTDDIADLSLRRAHSQNLHLAARSLENDSVAERDFTAITMAIDPSKIPQAKKLIRNFRNQLCSFLEESNQKQVYKFCMQLFPLSSLAPHGTRGESEDNLNQCLSPRESL